MKGSGSALRTVEPARFVRIGTFFLFIAVGRVR